MLQGTEKEFMDAFKPLCSSRSPWQVWSDLMEAIACSISNAADHLPEHYGCREEKYAQCIGRLGSAEAAAKIFEIIIMALENNPEQDFLGKMYMDLNLGSHWKSQFFTPYCVCRAMSEMSCGDIGRQIREKGYISVCDPTCGAGATLIAYANSMKRSGHNFQNHVLFVGQDIDRVAGMMCYIQLSLLGCAGYICIGNTLTDPLTGPALFPNENDGQELWYMPMFHSEIWQWRRVFSSLVSMGGTVTAGKAVEKERYFMFFYFDEKEGNYGD